MKRCLYCGEPVEPGKELCYQGVSGWAEYKRKGGGTNVIHGRKPKDLWACRWCVEKIKRGVAPGQVSLIAGR